MARDQFPVDVVGESHYQEHFDIICGPRTREGVDLVTEAMVFCEDDNPQDPLAVRVEIQGMTVGYLPEKHRDAFRKWSRKTKNRYASCSARIRGGWMRGPQDLGNYGVRLNCPEAEIKGGCGRNVLLAVGLAFVGFMLIAILGNLAGGNSSNATPTPTKTPIGAGAAAPAEDTPTPVPADTPTPIPPTPLPAVGSDVYVGQVRWRVLSAEDLGNTLTSDNRFIDDVSTAGRFIKVRFEVENMTKDMLSFSGLDLVDSQERSFIHFSEDYQFIQPDQERCIFENINPNVPKTCQIIYEVPADATGLTLEVTDLKFLGFDSAFVDLALP